MVGLRSDQSKRATQKKRDQTRTRRDLRRAEKGAPKIAFRRATFLPPNFANHEVIALPDFLEERTGSRIR